ncbi:Mbov_0395 family pilin-like conjugal transfer protein [Candidatus Southlakia epibionticum]|jgi:hypothetical protein cdiviTM7_00647|uniref:Pilin n=1 Tax=Candidatus Southlakia epibionticum TaxID=3043284 RepID=A0ABY8WXI9_9BACT|nr:pilin [Candidatus Saccharimonadaceae bacterium ML1]
MKLNITKERIVGLLAVPVLALTVGSAPAFAASLSISGGANSARGNDQSGCLFGNEPGCEGTDQTPIFKTITNVLLFIIGAISVIMLIIGGIRYTTSNGDQQAVQNAKNTILYAVVGLVIAILAFAAINFVISSFVNRE